MKRLNNKGYMLVEIILAFSIAMAIMYFITELTIKLKNKNDDLLVRTLTSTDQAIIYNIIMDNIYDGNASAFDCSNATIDTANKKFTYNSKSVILNEYVDTYSCSGNKITIGVKALPDYNFDVVIPS